MIGRSARGGCGCGLNRSVLRIAAVLLLLVLAACKQESLYTGLSEQEANEMVALMQKAGIASDKVAVKDQLFSVTTRAEHFADAVQLLKANGLPRPKFQSLGEVFGEDGFVTSDTAQRARLMHALSQEISHTISSIDGVILARVHLAVPKRDPLSDVPVESSASVFVKHRADVDLSGHVSQIKALVINGLENLDYDNVTVALFEALPQSAHRTGPTLLAPPADGNAALGEQPAQQSLAATMSFVPEISPLGLVLVGLAVMSCVFFGLMCSFWLRLRNRADT